MPIYGQVPIRFQASIVSSPPAIPIDANTGLAPAFWRSQGLVVQVGVFDVDNVSIDLSNVSYLQLVLLTSQDALAPVVTKTVLSGALTPYVLWADWQAGIGQQASFVFSNAELDVSLAAQPSQTYWMVLQGVTSGGVGIIYAAGPVTIYYSGTIIPAPTPSFVSAHEQTSTSGNFTVTPEAQVHHEEITVAGSAGTRACIVTAAGLQKGALVALRFRLPNTAGIILQIYDQSLSGTLLATVLTQSDGFTKASRQQFWFDGANLQRDFEITPPNGQQS